MRYPQRTREEEKRRIIDKVYRRYPELPRFNAGQEFDIPLHTSAFRAHGECFGIGRIVRLTVEGMSLYEASQLTDIEKINALIGGIGECTSCTRGFSWHMNPNSRRMSVTFEDRIDQRRFRQ